MADGRPGAAIPDICFVERVFNATVAVIPDVDLYDRVFCRNNDGIVKRHVPDETRNALGAFTLQAQGHVDVARPGQHDHVVEPVICQVRHGTNADPEFGGGYFSCAHVSSPG